MRSLLKKIFIENWQRKIIGLILAIITWFFVNHSLTVTKIIFEVPVRIASLPKDRAIKGMQSDGILLDTMDLEIEGNKNLINGITKNDIEIAVDLKNNTKTEFKTLITKNNIVFKNTNINLERAIKKVKPQEFSVLISKLVIEKIPLVITQPIGEAPKGYQFLSVWPNNFYVTISGPEEIIKVLKAQGLQLSFNLNEISEKDLDTIEASWKGRNKDVISFFPPTPLKRITIPELSGSSFDIDDPNAKALKIDFIKQSFFQITSPIPVVLFFPLGTSEKLNPDTVTIANNNFVKKVNGIDMITIPLFAHRVSELFSEILNENMFILIFVESNEEAEELKWSVQFGFPSELEKRFFKKITAEMPNNEAFGVSQSMTKEYLTLKFRTYISKFRLWQSQTRKLALKITLENHKIHIIPVKK